MKSANYSHLLTLSILFAVVLFSSCQKEDDETRIDEPYVVEQADALAVFYESMFEVDSMFQLFGETFGLPVWKQPVIREAANDPNEVFVNGALSLGNFVLEFTTYEINAVGNSTQEVKSHRHALGLTTYMQDKAPILDSLGIQYHQPYAFVSTNGNGKSDTLYKNTFFYKGSYFSMCLCQMYPECYTCPKFIPVGNPDISDHQELHRHLKKQLDQNNGGPLGIKGVEKIVMATACYTGHYELFCKLFDPVDDNPEGMWKIKNGPAVELISAPYLSGMQFRSLVVNVRNLEKAKLFLDQQKMEYVEKNDGAIRLVGISKNLGFDFYLTQ
jgi:hypothetical protein